MQPGKCWLKKQDYAEALDDERHRPDLTAGVDLPGLKQRLDGFGICLPR